MHKYFTLLICLLSVSTSFAGSVWKERADVGYWFYQMPKKIHKPITRPIKANDKNHQQMKRKIDCQNPSEWNATCGFIVPKTFGFEQKEYHKLLQNFAMHSGDINTTYQFQKFNYWAVSQAMTSTYTWQYNMAQHPNIDSTVNNPVSQFGNILIMNIKSNKKKAFFKMLARSSMMVYFSRSDCPVCHAEAPIIKNLAEKTGIPLWNASLDKKPLPGFKHYMVYPKTIAPAERLHVARVPALFVFLYPNANGQGAKWIRVTNGLNSEATIENRIINFVQAYRHAVIEGANKDASQKKQQSENFSALKGNPLGNAATSITGESK